MEHRSISIADQIFDQLERDILAGKYARGEVMSELGLSKQLGVSRTPIREAIRRLEQEDFLEESGRGAVVVGISREDMEDMYEIRAQIEGLAARRAALNVTDEDCVRCGTCWICSVSIVRKTERTARTRSRTRTRNSTGFFTAVPEVSPTSIHSLRFISG